MTSFQDLVDVAVSAAHQGNDTEQHVDAVSQRVEECRAASDADAAGNLLQHMHDSLLPQGGANAAQQAGSRDAVLCDIMTQSFDNVALLASLSDACHQLATLLIGRYACSAPREAGILLLACLGRQVGCVHAVAVVLTQIRLKPQCAMQARC
jgi:hypothetical protein